MDVRGKLVIVTGASQGIGAATSKTLAEHGARVILVARTESKLQALADEIASAGGEAHARACDLSDPGAVASLGQAISDELGVPDVIVNSAGAGRWLAVDETPLDEIGQMMRAPYLAAFYVTRVFLPAIIERGNRPGRQRPVADEPGRRRWLHGLRRLPLGAARVQRGTPRRSARDRCERLRR